MGLAGCFLQLPLMQGVRLIRGKVMIHSYRSILFLGFFLAAFQVIAAEQSRVFDPQTQKFYAGLGSSAWWPEGDGICGVELPSTAGCWGHNIAYVRETTKGGKVICSTLLAAKTTKVSVNYKLDVTGNGQCEIVEIEYSN